MKIGQDVVVKEEVGAPKTTERGERAESGGTRPMQVEGSRRLGKLLIKRLHIGLSGTRLWLICGVQSICA